MQSTLQQGNWQKQWSLAVAKAWSDEEFKQRLMTDPAAVLAEYGVEAPAGIELRIVEDSEQVRYLVLPPSPSGDLSDEELSCSIGLDSFSGMCGGCGRCGCGSRGCDGYER
jgi:hypothetical protein